MGAGEDAMTRGDLVRHAGGCHCRAVRFEVDAPARLTVQICNCSICRMTAFEHLIVPAARFRLLAGAGSLLTYTFNTGVARHLFCRHCGIKSFYVPRSNPDAYSVNVRCIDPGTIAAITTEAFDGAHWERHGSSLKRLSED